MGRPTRYKAEYAEQAAKLCKLGLTDKEMAKFFEVSESTLNNWKQSHPAFLESLKGGKEMADAEVAAKLFHRATGYEHPEDDIRAINGEIVITPTIKHYPPDTTAAIFWLKNRQPAKWRDRPEAEQSGDGMHKILSDLIAKLPG
ncbi:transposase [Stutzerimonas kunmingensis]|uniref:transposase n=1 Tax=Stutzerimonas kunmingensis TaxID=1211807 RepID=UPI0028ACFB9A|nr:transposase [Stutzerimonas kunmingensis]